MREKPRRGPGLGPDPQGLAVARAVQEALPEARVILFGSRARGDHRPESDSDLVIIYPNGGNRNHYDAQADHHARQAEEKLGLKTGHDIILLSDSEYRTCSRATQHMAGQAKMYGIDMSEEYRERYQPEDEYSDAYDPDAVDQQVEELLQGITEATDAEKLQYPAHWPATELRITAALKWLKDCEGLAEVDEVSQDLLGFTAQQSLENALKGWLSTHIDDRTYGHGLVVLWNDIQKVEDFTRGELQPVREAMDDLMDYTSFTIAGAGDSSIKRNWLEKYAENYRHSSTEHVMYLAARKELQEKISQAVPLILEQVRERSQPDTA